MGNDQSRREQPQRSGGRVGYGSSPTSVKTFLFGTLAIPFTPLCQCLSDETVKPRTICPASLSSGE